MRCCWLTTRAPPRCARGSTTSSSTNTRKNGGEWSGSTRPRASVPASGPRARHGGRARVWPALPVARHEPRLGGALGGEGGEPLPRRNYYRLLEVWGKRQDLLRE